MVFKIVITWIISCIMIAVIYPDKFFYLLYGLVFGVLLFIFVLCFAIGDYLLTKVNLKKRYLHLILIFLIIFIIAILLGEITGLIIVGIVGITYFLVDQYKIFIKK